MSLQFLLASLFAKFPSSPMRQELQLLHIVFQPCFFFHFFFEDRENTTNDKYRNPTSIANNDTGIKFPSGVVEKSLIKCQVANNAEMANGITMVETDFGNQNSSVVRTRFVIVRSIRTPVIMVASI